MAVSLTQHLYPGQGGTGGYGVPKPPATPHLYPGQGGLTTPPNYPGQGGPGGYTYPTAGGYVSPNPPQVTPPAQVTTRTPTYGTPGDTTSGVGSTSGIDWTGLIGRSWEVSQAQAMMAEQMGRARAGMKADLRQNFIDLGIGDTSKLGSLGSYIDKDTIQAAINNKYSVYGQAREGEARANAQNSAQLASRGIMQSGQATTNAENVINQAESGRYTGLREFLRSGQTGLTHLGDVESQMAQGVMNAQFSAAQRIAQENAAAQAAANAQAAQAAANRAAEASAQQAQPWYQPTYQPTPAAASPGNVYDGGTYQLPGTDSWIVPGGGGAPVITSPTINAKLGEIGSWAVNPRTPRPWLS